jgi:hypothetical protein
VGIAAIGLTVKQLHLPLLLLVTAFAMAPAHAMDAPSE